MGNVTSNVAAKFAFFPPDPPTYDVIREEDGRLVFSGLTADKNVDVHLLDTKVGSKVVATFWRHPFARFTILYSHGNAADLGQMQELFIELRAHLRVNIMRFFLPLFSLICVGFLCSVVVCFSSTSVVLMESGFLISQCLLRCLRRILGFLMFSGFV